MTESTTPPLSIETLVEEPHARLQCWLDDFDRENADDIDSDDFNVGQDELIEVPAEDLRVTLDRLTSTLEENEGLKGERDKALNRAHEYACALDQRPDLMAAFYRSWSGEFDRAYEAETRADPAEFLLAVMAACAAESKANGNYNALWALDNQFKLDAAEARSLTMERALEQAAKGLADLPTMPTAYNWTGSGSDMFDNELRHTGAKPIAYLRGWLSIFRQFGYATRDESWGELEKLISIVMRNYGELARGAQAALAALSTPIGDQSVSDGKELGLSRIGGETGAASVASDLTDPQSGGAER